MSEDAKGLRKLLMKPREGNYDCETHRWKHAWGIFCFEEAKIERGVCLEAQKRFKGCQEEQMCQEKFKTKKKNVLLMPKLQVSAIKAVWMLNYPSDPIGLQNEYQRISKLWRGCQNLLRDTRCQKLLRQPKTTQVSIDAWRCLARPTAPQKD